jgi:hypothetical protein
MSSEWLACTRRVRWARLLGIGLTVTLAIVAALIAPLWLWATIPDREIRRAAQALLLAAQPAYGVTLAVIAGGLLVLGVRLIREEKVAATKYRRHIWWLPPFLS